MSFRQKKPVMAGMLHQPPSSLDRPLLRREQTRRVYYGAVCEIQEEILNETEKNDVG